MTVILLGTIWTFNMFPVIFLVTGGQPAGQTEILVTGAYRAAFQGIRNYSLVLDVRRADPVHPARLRAVLPAGAAQARRGVVT